MSEPAERPGAKEAEKDVRLEEVAAAPSPAREREVTARALLLGCALGAPLAIGNVYMGLKTGWWESGTITSSLLGFSVASAWARRRGRPYSLLENNLTQTVAAAVGAMPAAAGLLGAIPALGLQQVRVPGWGIALWGAALGVLGVLVALSLRKRLIEDEALPFPTGIATAELLRTLHSPGGERPGRSRALLLAGAAGMLVGWLRDAARKVPAFTALPGRLAGASAGTFTLGLNWSPMMIAIGALAGPLIGLSLLLGAVIAWGVLGPWLVSAGVATLDGDSGFGAWLTWPGVGLMVGAALASLVGEAGAFLGAARDVRALSRGGLRGVGAARGWVGLAGISAIVAVALAWPVLGLPPHQAALAMLLVFPLGSVCARAAGQTDISPVSQMGQLTQAAAGMAGARTPALNVAAGAVVSSALAQTGVSMWTLKAGREVGASPWAQARAQLLGVLVGAAVGVPAYLLLTHAYTLGSGTLPAPTAIQANAIALVATRGLAGLPRYAAGAALAGFLVGAGTTVASRGRWARFIPSGAAMGIGFIVPAHYSVAICLGALVTEVARRISPERTARYAPALAAGGIAGEALMGVLVAALVATGILAG